MPLYSGPVATPDAPADSRAVAIDTGPVVKPDAPPDNRPVAGDAPVGAPDAPIDNRTFAGDTGPVVTPDAPADNRSVAVDTGPVGLADGGAETSGPQPRVLVIDPATDQFLTYDRDGLPVHDYHSALRFRRWLRQTQRLGGKPLCCLGYGHRYGLDL